MYFCCVKITRHILVGLLILFTFIGNVGMSVFTHSCKEDGVFRSYFVKTQDHCNDEKEEIKPPCCQNQKKVECTTEIEEKDCCNDEVDIFKINLDYFSDSQLSLPVIGFYQKPITFNFSQVFTHALEYNPEHYIHPPPRLSGKDILIKIQVFRI